MAQPNSFTHALTPAQIETLRGILEDRGFEFRTVPYAHFGAAKNKAQITAYLSGKTTFQGKDAKEFIEFTLEPLVLGEAKLGYEKELNPAIYAAHIGVDESGKGDFFGPMVAAGVYAPDGAVEKFVEIGVRDSKTISSAKVMGDIAKAVRETPGVLVEIIRINNPSYNKLQKKMGSVNEVLGWAHACAIQNLVAKSGCQRVITDKFAKTDWTVRKYLPKMDDKFDLVQRHKAESDPVVAAASIVARDAFNRAMAELSAKFGRTIPFGASAQVLQVAKELLASHGEEVLAGCVKTHFRTWNQVRGLPVEEKKWNPHWS